MVRARVKLVVPVAELLTKLFPVVELFTKLLFAALLPGFCRRPGEERDERNDDSFSSSFVFQTISSNVLCRPWTEASNAENPVSKNFSNSTGNIDMLTRKSRYRTSLDSVSIALVFVICDTCCSR